jgi:hypothetical protein
VTIHRGDLESKLREIESVVSDAESDVRRRSRVLLIGAAVVVTGYVAYRIWRSRNPKIRIEVYHQS